MDEPGLLLQVFAKLGLRDLFKLRLVCKSWYVAVLCPRFRQLYKPAAGDEQPWSVFTIRDRRKQVVELKIWRPLDSGSRLGEWSFLQLKGLCSSGGLVCGELGYYNRPLVVVNPITRELTGLPQPPPLAPNVELIGYFMETRADSSYTVVALHRDEAEEHYYAMHYESATRSWHKGGGFSAAQMKDRDSVWRPLVGSACYYRCIDNEKSVLVYDLQSEAWTYAEFELPLGRDPFGGVKFISVVRYRGKYYCASLLKTLLGEEDEDIVIGAAIWELKAPDEADQAGGGQVTRLVRVSEFFNVDSGNLQDVAELCLQHVRVELVGDTVFFSTVYRKKTVYRDPRDYILPPPCFGLWFPIAYNFARNVWYSSLDKPAEDEDVDTECYSFIPSLTACP